MQRRAVLVSVAILAASCLPSAADEPRQLRVLSYNIHHGAGVDGKLDLQRIADVIVKCKPDVVALQEVDKKTTRSGGVDQAAELGRLTNMRAEFGKAMDYAGGQYGVAILARHPLTDMHVHTLPFTEGREPRAALQAGVEADGDGPGFVLIATHLEHADRELRLAQAQALGDIVPQQDAVAFLVGDLNAVPGSPPINALLRRWTDASAKEPQPTWPADQPRVRIDYVLYRPATAWRVVASQVIDERVASDHRPLLVVLERVAP